MGTRKRKVAAPATRGRPSMASDLLLHDVRGLIEATRLRTAQSVSGELVSLCWQIGTRIRTDILKGRRAGYGKEVVALLAERLTSEYGKGFSRSNLSYMVRFAEAFPDEATVPGPQHTPELVALPADHLPR